MDYNQGHHLLGSSSLPQPSYYGSDPYSYAAAAASSAPSYCYHQPSPQGTEHAAPPAFSSYSSTAEVSYYAADRMNPAAASAPTQLTDFAASMGVSERAADRQVYPPRSPTTQHPSAVCGVGRLMGGRRGGGPSRGRGRGRGSCMHHPPTQDIGVTSPHGRGQGQGQGRGGKVSGRQLAIHAPAISSTAEAQLGTTPAPAQIQDVGQLPTANIARGHVLLVAWCDICRVGCNSKEILEQHKNGKRHKRTVQRIQEMAAGLHGMAPAISDMVTLAPQVRGLPGASSELAEGSGPSGALQMFQPVGSSSHGGEEHKNVASENAIASVTQVQVPEATTGDSAQQNLLPPTKAVGHSVEPQVELYHTVVQAHQSANAMKEGSEAPPCNTSAHCASANVQSVGAKLGGSSSRNGPKRKTRKPERGAKKPRMSEAPRRRPERVREQPLVCTLCNATCDTRAVFDIHLGGKKHLSRLKRSQCTDTFGPLVLYIPPNQPAAHPVGAPEPMFYSLRSRDMVEKEVHLLSTVQHAFPVLPQAGQAPMAAEGTQVASDASYVVLPMACAVDNSTDKASPLTEEYGNVGPVTAPLGTASVLADAKEASPPL